MSLIQRSRPYRPDLRAVLSALCFLLAVVALAIAALAGSAAAGSYVEPHADPTRSSWQDPAATKISGQAHRDRLLRQTGVGGDPGD